jgi:ABC-type protease/lipase transport system fused ATPase/permease subunit
MKKVLFALTLIFGLISIISGVILVCLMIAAFAKSVKLKKSQIDGYVNDKKTKLHDYVADKFVKREYE